MKIRKLALFNRKSTYPLKPQKNLRQGVIRFNIDSRTSIEVFWKEIEFGTGPAFSLFVDQHEVLRFDCSGPETGHFHVANGGKFCRVWMFEKEIKDQIERGIFEIEKNLDFYIKQNPISEIRATNFDSVNVHNACTDAKLKLFEYMEQFR